ncbi:MAG: gas vesicle protein GvpO [Micromonosporaceae bacterium]
MAGNEQRDPLRQERDTPKSNGSAAKAVRAAVREFRDLTGLEPDAVTGVRGIDDGWSVLVDVVELERIPSSTSVMATYRVDVDPDGELRSYERLRRYNRGAADPT